MDSSVRNDQAPSTQQDPKRFLMSLTLIASIIKRLAGLIQFTEEEREDAGIFLHRPGDE